MQDRTGPMDEVGNSAGRLDRPSFVVGGHDRNQRRRSVFERPAKLMNLSDYGIAVGNPADIVLLDCEDKSSAIAEVAQPLMVFKKGQMTVSRPAPVLHRPAQGGRLLKAVS